MNEDVYSIWLNSISVSSNIKIKILEEIGSFRSIYYLRKQDYLSFGLTETQAQKFIEAQDKIDKSAEILEYTQQNNIDVINIAQKEYPISLNHINEPPLVLYGRGNKSSLHELSIAVVGSRKCSEYGFFTAKKFAQELAEMGICVVSGLAMGIDAAAHQGALSVKQRTVAVLGSRIDACYPAENSLLYNQILNQEGYIISEYAPGYQTKLYNFSRRNRIISGLSFGVLVVEAAYKSGALITAHHALVQGKSVFAVPANLGSGYGSGSNELIQQGAKLVQNVQDIIDDFPYYIRIKLKTSLTENLLDEKFSLDKNESLVYDCLSWQTAKSFSELEKVTTLSSDQLNRILVKFEIIGVVSRIPGNRYIKNR